MDGQSFVAVRLKVKVSFRGATRSCMKYYWWRSLSDDADDARRSWQPVQSTLRYQRHLDTDELYDRHSRLTTRNLIRSQNTLRFPKASIASFSDILKRKGMYLPSARIKVNKRISDGSGTGC